LILRLVCFCEASTLPPCGTLPNYPANYIFIPPSKKIFPVPRLHQHSIPRRVNGGCHASRAWLPSQRHTATQPKCFPNSARLPFPSSFPLPPFLTTPSGPQTSNKNLTTFFEYLEISSRALSIFCVSISPSATHFVLRSTLELPHLVPIPSPTSIQTPPNRSHVQAIVLVPSQRPRREGCEVEEAV